MYLRFPKTKECKMKSKLLFWVSALAFLTVAGCECTQNNQEDTTPKDNEAIEAQLAQMSLRQKVGQLFCTRPEALDPVFAASGRGMTEYKMQAVNEETRAFCEKYPLSIIRNSFLKPRSLTFSMVKGVSVLSRIEPKTSGSLTGSGS